MPRRPRIVVPVSLLVLGLRVCIAVAHAQEPVAVSPSGAPPSAADQAAEPRNDAKLTPTHATARAAERTSAAKLTPIVVSPHHARTTAFQLYVEIDIPVLATSAILASARLLRTTPPACQKVGDHCDPAELNAFDRQFAGTWRPGWGTYSDLGLAGLMVGAGTLMLVDEGPWSALNDAVVVAESALVATALPSMTTLATSRPRPYTYGSEAPLSTRTTGAAGLSFISSHTSISFAIATSMFFVAKRLHPGSALPWIVLGTGLALAASVAAARVLAGQHFPTDVLSGAVIGASVGTVVSSAHRLPVQVTPTAGGAQLSLTRTF
ncbi:MAG TPA: phosphatase PAP2 family protein [Polyangiales bacterium]